MSAPTYYRSPADPGQPGAFDWRSPMIGLASFVTANFLVTQWLAFVFGSVQLGEPWHRVMGIPVYLPWSWFVWPFKFWLNTPAARPYFITAMMMVAFTALGTTILTSALISRRQRKAADDKGDMHGSAQWASDADVLESGLFQQTSGPFVGGWERKEGYIEYLRDPSDGHILCFAPTGSGKTSGLVAPTLLSNEHYSVLALDPKEQLFNLTSGYRKKAGNAVFKFSPATASSSRFNVFDEIRLGTDRDVADASNIALMHCKIPGEGSSDPHWTDIAMQLATGVILHEAYRAKNEGRSVSGIDIAEAFTPSQATFQHKLQEMVTYAHDPAGTCGWTFPGNAASSNQPVATRNHPVVRAAANAMIFHRMSDGEPNKEFSACLSEAEKRFAIYRDPLIRRATSASDFSIDNLVNRDAPTTLYLCIPLSDEDRLRPLVRVVLTMIFQRLTEQERLQHPNKHTLLWLLDEFPTLREMPIILHGMPLSRDFGHKFFLIAQSIGQIDREYKDHQVLVNNCDTWCVYSPNDDETAQLISRKSGKRTVAHRVQSFSGKRYGSSKEQITESVSHSERELITADEVRRLRSPRKDGKRIVEPGDMLIFTKGHRPIFGRQMLYFFDEGFKNRAAMPAVII